MTEFDHSRSDFPEGFFFAAATSAYQIEGHAHGAAGRTHWDSFAAVPGKVMNRETGAQACDHYHRWPADLDLMREAGFDAYRFSTSWARIMPNGRQINAEGLDFYDRLVDGMLARGLRPMATLYHWELPDALARKGGWTSREIPERFAEFSAIVGRRLGDRLYATAPINEPWCVAWLGHYLGQHAPGLTDLPAAARAMHHVALAHGLSVQALRSEDVGNIGAVCNLEYALPATDEDEDVEAATLYDGLYNRWFPGAMTKGEYPEDILEGLADHMPEGWQDDMKDVAQPIDWFGINYYTCQRLRRAGKVWPHVGTVPGPLPRTDMGWEVCPEGLTALLRRTAADYTGEMPIFITENGLAVAEAETPDTSRIAYLDAHLGAALAAIEAGVPLKGYTVWSLLDNYEWAFGYSKRFGLVHVDFGTQARTPRASYHALARALAR